MAKKVTPANWQERVFEGQRYQQDICRGAEWPRFRDFYRGDFGDDLYFYNLYYTLIHTLRPSIYFRDPHVTVTPWKRFSPDPDPMRNITARVLESMDNLLLRQLRVKDLVRQLIFDAFLCGRAIVKYGFSSEFYTPKPGTDENPQLSKNERLRTEFSETVQNGMPWVKRVGPEFFIVPYGTTQLKTSPWAAHLILRPTEDVRNSVYYNTKDLEINSTHLALLQDYVSEYRNVVSGEEWTELHEIHDQRTGEVSVYIPGYGQGEGLDRWVRKPEKDVIADLLGQLPFDTLSFTEDPDYFWGTSDAIQIEPQQREINITREQTIRHREIALLKLLVKKGALEKEELAKLISGDVGPCIEVNGDVREAVTSLQPHIPPDLGNWPEFIRGDSREVVGVSRQHAGGVMPGRRTKFEMEMVEEGFGVRIGEKRDLVASLIERMMISINKITSHFWDAEEIVPVVGLDAAIYWIRYKNSDIKGEFEVRVDAESLSAASTMQRRQEALQLIANLGQHPNVNVDQLMSELLSTYDWLELSNILPQATGQPQSIQQFLQQQQGLGQETRVGGLQAAAQMLGTQAPPQLGGAPEVR